jgi:hypothetical protein
MVDILMAQHHQILMWVLQVEVLLNLLEVQEQVLSVDLVLEATTIPTLVGTVVVVLAGMVEVPAVSTMVVGEEAVIIIVHISRALLIPMVIKLPVALFI